MWSSRYFWKSRCNQAIVVLMEGIRGEWWFLLGWGYFSKSRHRSGRQQSEHGFPVCLRRRVGRGTVCIACTEPLGSWAGVGSLYCLWQTRDMPWESQCLPALFAFSGFLEGHLDHWLLDQKWPLERWEKPEAEDSAVRVAFPSFFPSAWSFSPAELWGEGGWPGTYNGTGTRCVRGGGEDATRAQRADHGGEGRVDVPRTFSLCGVYICPSWV